VMRFHGAYKIFEFSTIIGNTESRFIITLYVERSSRGIASVVFVKIRLNHLSSGITGHIDWQKKD